MSNVPHRVRAALPSGQVFDWIALIPPELQDREVLSLLNSSGADSVYHHDLETGEILLAGTTRSSFDVSSLLIASAGSVSDAESPKARRATAPGNASGSGSRS